MRAVAAGREWTAIITKVKVSFDAGESVNIKTKRVEIVS